MMVKLNSWNFGGESTIYCVQTCAKYQIELLMFDGNTWNILIERKQMRFYDLFENNGT